MLNLVAKYSASITRVDVMVKIRLSAGAISKRTDQYADIVSAWFLGCGVLNSSIINPRRYRSCPIGHSCHTEEVGRRILPPQ